MRKLSVGIIFVITFIFVYELCYSADVRFGAARAVKERKKDLDEKIEKIGEEKCKSACISTETISRNEHYMRDAERRNYVITNKSEWANLWGRLTATHSPKPVLPEVCFKNCMIVAVFQGIKSSGGYEFEISNITETNTTLEVFIKETCPCQGCLATLAVTSPYHIIKTKRVEKEVRFQITSVVGNCP